MVVPRFAVVDHVAIAIRDEVDTLDGQDGAAFIRIVGIVIPEGLGFLSLGIVIDAEVTALHGGPFLVDEILRLIIEHFCEPHLEKSRNAAQQHDKEKEVAGSQAKAQPAQEAA